jgi:hypothetical protein
MHMYHTHYTHTHTHTLYTLFPPSTQHRRDKEKRSALHHAAAGGNISIVSLLIDSGLKPDSRDIHWVTPFMLACTHLRLSLVTLLVEKNASVHIKDKRGETCLHHIARIEAVASHNKVNKSRPLMKGFPPSLFLFLSFFPHNTFVHIQNKANPPCIYVFDVFQR